MSDLKNVPLTITATLQNDSDAQMAIGRERIPLPGKPSSYVGGYWVAVVDRRSLKVVYNKVLDSYDTAPDIGNYNTSDYMLFTTTMWLGTGHVPQGAFYDFLMDNGAGAQLQRVCQLNNTLGCGTWSTVAYCLAGVLGPGLPATRGVEMGSIGSSDYAIIMTATLVPAQIGDTVIYTPSPLSG
jgi:hypothetical protein